MLEENNVGANSQPESSAPQPAAPTAGAGTLVQLPAGSAALVEEENMAANSQPESSAPQPAATTAGAGTLVQRLRQELAHCERAHVDRLQGYQERLAVLATAPRRRGRARQQQHRELERGLRQEAVAFYRQVCRRGGGLAKAAQALHVAPRTLRHWARQTRAGKLLAAPLGRPAAQAEPAERAGVLQFLADKGPGVGVPTLQEHFPDLARAELTDLCQEFRRHQRQQTRQRYYRLLWQRPGSVWAIDFAEPSWRGARWSLPPIDGVYPYLLAVRDLASGYQLAWLPVPAATADVVVATLAALFARYGLPLLLKCDNGAPFRAELTKAFLQAVGVLPLFSPWRCPRYNGAIEATIGSLKSRTQQYAAWHGRLLDWTSSDVAAARRQANTTAPLVHGPTPAETWALRTPVRALQRVCFELAVARHRYEVRSQKKIAQDKTLNHWEEGVVDRKAIQRALVEHGYLLFRRRRIPTEI